MTYTLFDIPVYRVSPDDWSAEIQKLDDRVEAARRKDVPEGVDPDPDSIRRSQSYHRHVRGYDLPWVYNQVIGWVLVARDGWEPVIEGTAYRMAQKRIHRNSRAPYEWIGRAFILQFRDETSEEIGGSVRSELTKLTRSGEVFHRRYIDLDAFDSLAPHLDWRRLIGVDA
jgi:hypothetical protein